MINTLKKFPAASLTESIRKNKLRVAVYSLLMMLAASVSILSCDEGIRNLETEWRSLYEVNRLWKDATKATAEGQPRDLRRYDIKISLKRLAWSTVRIRFCDQYGFLLAGWNMRTGVYYRKWPAEKKYVSTVKYPSSPLLQQRMSAQQRMPAPERMAAWQRKMPQQRLQDTHLRLKCDLAEKKVLVYMDGKLMEEVKLGSEPLKYSFGLAIPPGRYGAMLNELKISDPKGRVLCDVNFAPLFFYKRISQAFLFLGALVLLCLGARIFLSFGAPIFSSLAGSARLLFREALLFVRPMLSPMLWLLVMVAASFSIMFCQKEISKLDRKWRSLYALGAWGEAHHQSSDESRSFNPVRYDIQVGLTRLFDNDFNICSVRIQFCDQYSFIWSGEAPSSGVYNVAQGWGKYVSTAEYPHIRREKGHERSKHLDLRVKCDLTEKTALVYVNGKFMEKVALGPGPLRYDVGVLVKPSFKNITLEKLKISGAEGKVLCDIDFAPLIFYKRISQAFLILGTLIFLVMACSEKLFLRRAFLFMILLVFLEAFLRMTYSRNPDFDISQMKPRWRFEVATNFYGAFNDPKEITVNPYFFPLLSDPKTYTIANPEHAMRIICLGSSPVEGVTLLPRQRAFPALLESKINPSNETKNRVIPITMPMGENTIGPVASTFLYEVASRLNPDLILVYGAFPPTGEGDYADDKTLIEECVLYDKAKKLIEKNPDWIKNDRLLYAALEFKKPVKEIVYLYDFLCKSYLFMAVENIRKKVFNQWSSAYGKRSADRKLSVEKPEFFFEKLLKLCRKKKIKVALIPPLDFSMLSELPKEEEAMTVIREKYPEIYLLSLKNVFSVKENFLLGNDTFHPSGYGHQVIAEELFRQLTEKGLLNSHKAIE